MIPVALSDHERETIARAILPFRDRVHRVIVFGSRANGKSKPSSDIDIAVDGLLSEAEFFALFAAFDDSDLAVRIDVVDYRQVCGTALGRHIDAVGVPLTGLWEPESGNTLTDHADP